MTLPFYQRFQDWYQACLTNPPVPRLTYIDKSVGAFQMFVQLNSGRSKGERKNPGSIASRCMDYCSHGFCTRPSPAC